MFSSIGSHTGLLLSLLAIGGVGGFFSGLLGVGGGIIFVPALFYTMTAVGVNAGVAMHVAVGTSLALVLATGASSAFWHHKKRSVDFAILKSWAPAVVVGVAAGTYFASVVDGASLKKVFAVITGLVALYMAFSKEPKDGQTAHRLSPLVQRLGAAVIGGLSALIGVGGAGMSIPFMAYIGVPIRTAVGTGGALAVAISLPAAAGYIAAGLNHAQGLPAGCWGYVNLLALLMILPVSMLLSPIGVHVSHRLPRIALRRIFAGIVILVSLQMFFT